MKITQEQNKRGLKNKSRQTPALENIQLTNGKIGLLSVMPKAGFNLEPPQ
jgi:hypothetical protein